MIQRARDILKEKGLNFNIMASLLGAFADPFAWDFSCIDKVTGKLIKEKYAAYMRIFSECGATCTRELPFLVSEDQTRVVSHYMPYKYMKGKEQEQGWYNLKEFNNIYFENLRAAAWIANEHGLTFCFSLFDHGGHGDFLNTPWRRNAQYIYSFMDRDAIDYRKDWIRMVVESLHGLDVWYEAINEPKITDDTPGLIQEIIANLVFYHKMPLEKICIGARFMYPGASEKVNENMLSMLRKVKKELRGGLYFGKALWDKKKLFSKVVHNANEDFFKNYTHIQKHLSRFFISNDGIKPKYSAKKWEKLLTPFFQAVKPKRNKFFKLGAVIEAVTRMNIEKGVGVESWCPALDSQFNEDLYAALGIARAFKNATGIRIYKNKFADDLLSEMKSAVNSTKYFGSVGDGLAETEGGQACGK